MLVMIDLDNTLSDRAAAVEAWAAEFAEAHNLADDAIDWIIDLDNDGYSQRSAVFEAIAKRFAIEVPVEQLLADYQRRVIELATPAPGALGCLAAMRARQWTIVILSNGSSGQQHGKIDALGLRSMVDGVCISGDLQIKKPAAEIFHAAASQVGMEITGRATLDIWMVGDSPLHDIVGASELGLATAWLDRGRSWPDHEVAAAHPGTEPTVAIGSLAELVGAIDSNRNESEAASG